MSEKIYKFVFENVKTKEIFIINFKSIDKDFKLKRYFNLAIKKGYLKLIFNYRKVMNIEYSKVYLINKFDFEDYKKFIFDCMNMY